jgi:hypothetical protein
MPGGSWERIRLSPTDWDESAARIGDSIIRLSPEWDDVPALYWCNALAGAGPFTNDIQKSTTGGDMFSGRTPPVSIADVAVENADILYLGDSASNNVFTSTNGAWFFGLPVSSGVVGVCYDLAMAPSYPEKPIAGYVLASGTAAGLPFRSPSGGAFWIPITPSIPGAGPLQIIADVDFANNNTVYAGDATGVIQPPIVPGPGVAATGVGIWRFEIGTSTVWEQINATPAYVTLGTGIAIGIRQITGLAAVSGSGVLYGSFLGNVGGNSGAERSLVPEIPVIASWIWDRMDIGSALGGGVGAARRFQSPPNALRVSKSGSSVHLWAINTAPTGPAPRTLGSLMAYEDTMALADVEATVPEMVEASLAEMARGWNSQFSVSWTLISNATDYEVQIASDPGITNVVVTSIPFGPVGPPWYIPANPLSPTLVVAEGTLPAGKDYFVRVRIRDQIPNDAIRSPWSSVYRFTVQGGEVVEKPYLAPVPMAPECGSTNSPASPGFTWSPYAKATRYEVQLATDAAFADILGEDKVSTTGWKYEGTLSKGSTYFWRVRTVEPTTSGWSPVCAFTVAEDAPPPVEVVIPPAPPPAEPAVSSAIIWAIIAIGAILVIAVIVLIIRTRRAT